MDCQQLEASTWDEVVMAIDRRPCRTYFGGIATRSLERRLANIANRMCNTAATTSGWRAHPVNQKQGDAIEQERLERIRTDLCIAE